MKTTKKRKLEAAGWHVGTPADFLELTREEAAGLYPRLAEFRALCRQVDPHGVFQNDFSRRSLGFGDPETTA